MNRIEDIIKRGRSEFDDREPSDGHFERFSFKLATRLHSGAVKRSIIPHLLKAAVVTLLITLSSLWTFDHFVRPNLKRTMTLSEVSPEYREVERYYVQQVNLMENEFSSLDLSNPEQKEVLLQEMASMDSVYSDLQKELRANPNDQRIIDAMIKHYQTKLEVMSYILDQLKEIQAETANPVSHENVVY
ncbi:MAG TPA: hypothetical protein PLK17_04825 [Bacteroidales bacterium]|jgi:hypothetical protein|nr:hypothetical protein [Bacteroidales bacterium]HNT94416.1 hypothetical protein [Bacteroidales bacterium]HOO66733.1 hypothetical protein [Bacteroidales bacterium]HPJ04823.1 hypothetical protein [Bacteroidales bacterium]HPQ64126.1 hypothetical protein [Bacteroidales bacterium]